MADLIILDDTSKEFHPLQVNQLQGPKGAYTIKKIRNGYYIRLDMPGVNANDLVVEKNQHRKEVYFRGIAKRVLHNLISKKDLERHYAVTIKIYECSDFSEVLVDQKLIDGVCRILIVGVKSASVMFRRPKVVNVSGSPEAAQYNHHPYSFKIDGISAETDEHIPDCKCGCLGIAKLRFYTGPWSEEDGRIYPYIDPEKSAFETEFIPAEDGSGDYYLYSRIDMPGCKKQNRNLYLANDRTLKFVCHSSDLSEIDDKFRFDDAGGRRSYCCQINLICDLGDQRCCSFSQASKLVFHHAGVLRTIIRIEKNMPFKKQKLNLENDLTGIFLHVDPVQIALPDAASFDSTQEEQVISLATTREEQEKERRIQELIKANIKEGIVRSLRWATPEEMNIAMQVTSKLLMANEAMRLSQEEIPDAASLDSTLEEQEKEEIIQELIYASQKNMETSLKFYVEAKELLAAHRMCMIRSEDDKKTVEKNNMEYDYVLIPASKETATIVKSYLPEEDNSTNEAKATKEENAPKEKKREIILYVPRV